MFHSNIERIYSVMLGQDRTSKCEAVDRGPFVEVYLYWKYTLEARAKYTWFIAVLPQESEVVCLEKIG